MTNESAEHNLGKCNVCHTNDAIGVASSCLGPMSMCFCVQCLQQGAEAEHMLIYSMWTADKELGNIAKEVLEHVKTFKDGKYLSWTDWWNEYGVKIDIDAMFADVPPETEGGEDQKT